jgi:signal peptidase II
MAEIETSPKQSFDWRLLVPLSLTVVLLVSDQIIKALIVAHVPINTIYTDLGHGFFRIIHERNLGIALSIGNGAPDFFRTLLFKILPLVVLSAVVVYYFFGKDLNWYRRWTLAGILGGGFGNLLDRFFRPDGVVDFIDVKFYGIFGWERFPTFNIADASISVCSVLLFSSLLFARKRQ